MKQWSRRQFLATTLASASTAMFDGLAYGESLHTPLEGKFLGNLKFLEEFPREYHNPFDQGLEGRLITDLSGLSEEALITPNDRFFIRTRTPDQIHWNKRWTIAVEGQVKNRRTFQMSELLDLGEPQGEILLECSGNNRRNRSFGMLSAAEWDGVPLTTLLKKIQVRPEATRVLINGFDTHSQPSRTSVMGASWIYTFEQLEEHGAFLATHMNGERLPCDHGFPVRLIVPGWYGCCCVKWVDRIELVDDTASATSQMLEFSTRTHQGGRHLLAKDYIPANMDQAAMPIRIEKWAVGGKITYFIVGVMWGGEKLTKDLLVRFNSNDEQIPVQNVLGQSRNQTWGLWSHRWSPVAPGHYDITLKAADSTVRTRRLDIEYYRRSVEVDEV